MPIYTYTIFPNPPPDYPITITLRSVEIKHKSEIKLLGTYVQQDLKHDATIRHIIKKINIETQSLRYAKQHLTTETLITQYHSRIYPHLIGCIPVWGTEHYNTTYLQPLVRTHKRIIRLISKTPHRTHTQPLMTKHKILRLNNIYIYRVAVEMHPHIHKTIHTNIPKHIHHYTPASSIHRYPTRHARSRRNYVPSNSKNQKNKMNPFAKRYSHIWNTIPERLRETKDIDPFKRKLKDYLLAKQAGFIIPDLLI